MIRGLLLAGLLFVAAAETPPEEASLVAVYEDGSAQPLAADFAASGTLPEGIRHLWLWTKTTPPRRVLPTELPSALAAAARPESPEAKLRARLVRAAEVEAEPAEELLVAAPVEMWREVPEEHLPVWDPSGEDSWSLSRDREGTWRLRFVGQGLGSWWTDVRPGQDSLTLVARTAEDRAFEVRNPAQEAVAVANLSVSARPANGRAPTFLASFLADEKGRLLLPAVPDSGGVDVLVKADDYAPRLYSGWISSLPQVLELKLGASLRGRFVDSHQAPLADVEVVIETWAASDVPWLDTRRAASGTDGRWELQGLAPGTAALQARAPGLGRFEKKIELTETKVDLGDVVLWPTAVLTLSVVTADDLPLPGVSIRIGEELLATTGQDGKAALADLAIDPAIPLSVDAEGYVAEDVALPNPLPPELRVRLRPALVVLGQLVDSLGAPVVDGRCTVYEGSRQTTLELDPGGGFRLDLTPDAELQLELSSPATRAVRVRVEPGLPGEVRDLGVLQAPEGLVVTGTVLRAADGMPAVGARVWALRSREHGPLVALMRHDLVATATDAEGGFRLGGLFPGPGVLRFEAPGLANAFREVVPEPGEIALDVGTVEMSVGATVRVRVVDPEIGRATARADLRGEGLLPDILEAPVRDGTAVFQHVPYGPVKVTVIEDRALLCAEEVLIETGVADLEVDCEGSKLVVRGKVVVGEEPAAGRLVWSSPPSGLPSGIMSYRTPGGLQQQSVFAKDRYTVVTELGEEGDFSTPDLRPGPWNVVWYSSSAAPSEPRRIDLPETETHVVTLEYPDLALRGLVTDAQGQPVAGSRVRELVGKLTAFTDAEGRFELRVGSPGLRQVQATDGELASELAEIELAADRKPEPLHLVLGERRDDRFEVQVSKDGEAAGGALIFVDSDRGASRILTGDLQGKVVVRFHGQRPSRVRIAAFAGGAWAFGPWEIWQDALESTLR